MAAWVLFNLHKCYLFIFLCIFFYFFLLNAFINAFCLGPVLRHHTWDIRKKVSICFWCSPAVWRARPSNQPWHMFNIRRNRFPLNSGKNYRCFTSQSFELTTLANVPAQMDTFNSLSGICREGVTHIWLWFRLSCDAAYSSADKSHSLWRV